MEKHVKLDSLILGKSYEFSRLMMNTAQSRSIRVKNSSAFHGQIIDRFEKLSRAVFLLEKKKKEETCAVRNNETFRTPPKTRFDTLFFVWHDEHIDTEILECNSNQALGKDCTNTICFVLSNALYFFFTDNFKVMYFLENIFFRKSV